MMQYTNQQGAQGICPQGWHLPTDEELKVLEGAVDSQYGIGDPEWDLDYDRGFDAGTNLKATSDWNYGSNLTDPYGFSGLPAGYRDSSGAFYDAGYYGQWWLSAELNDLKAWLRVLGYLTPGVFRYDFGKEYGFSARCLKDY
jgi:uncharacterized protein (TIGR02145 family)